MDISQKYILMCSKAQEIQDLVKLKSGGSGCLEDGDWYARIDTFEVGCNGFSPEHINCTSLRENEVWLPRQDQLQEIIDVKGSWCFSTGLSPVCRCDYGGGYDKETDKELDYYDSFDSFEKSWLAYVMKEKYNKVWSEDQQDWLLK